jgi:hypothetical protein
MQGVHIVCFKCKITKFISQVPVKEKHSYTKMQGKNCNKWSTWGAKNNSWSSLHHIGRFQNLVNKHSY